MKMLTAMAVFFAGCTPSLGFDYTSGCTSMTSELELDQGRLDLHAALAQRMIDNKFGTGTYCRTNSTDVIEVFSDNWECVGYDKSLCTGESLMGHMKLAVHGQSLVHETIHMVEGRNGIISTAWHQGWKEAGYFDMDDDFTNKALHLRPEH